MFYCLTIAFWQLSNTRICYVMLCYAATYEKEKSIPGTLTTVWVVFTVFTEATNGYTDGISRHRLSPYSAYLVSLITNITLYCVSGSNCNLIFVLKLFNVVHIIQLSGKTFHFLTIRFANTTHTFLYPIFFFSWIAFCYVLFFQRHQILKKSTVKS